MVSRITSHLKDACMHHATPTKLLVIVNTKDRRNISVPWAQFVICSNMPITACGPPRASSWVYYVI